MEKLKVNKLFDFSHTLAAPLLSGCIYPWEAMEGIGEFIISFGRSLPKDIYMEREPQVWIARDAAVAPSASLTGPCIIGRGTEVRHCAFIRGKVLVGEGAVIGNSTELKNCILFDEVQVPHYNYVGDSILGYRAHMGAGAVTSNVKCDKSNVCVRCDGEIMQTGLRKFGAAIGDQVEIGCGAVLNPGTVVGRGSIIYPLVPVRGYVPENSIVKDAGKIVKKV
jgi:NDP-sugar pyrophosphorylase family protein